MSDRTKLWGMGLVCLVLLPTAASLLRPQSAGLAALSDVLQLVLLLSAAISCLPSVFRNHGRIRLFWGLMCGGLASWAIYQFLWTYVEVLQRREVPSLWGPGIILFLPILPMMAALPLQPDFNEHDRA